MRITAIIIAVGLLLGRTSGHAQGFVNLNFASAGIPTGTASGSFVPISEAIPGWIGYIGTNQVTSVLYNGLYTGSPTLALLSMNTPGAIPGNAYTVVLQAGGDVSFVNASIAQTGLIPATANSILFTASLSNPNLTEWQVTIAGQIIPVIQISTIDTYYGVFEGNISAFAGQVDQLEFTALTTASDPYGGLLLDGISFSSSPVPEPGEFALAGLAASLLGLRRWKPTLK